MTAFAPFAADDGKSRGLLSLLPQKLAYIVCNALTLAVGLWKCRSMGLLPTGTADWLAFERRGEVSVTIFKLLIHLNVLQPPEILLY
jgi:ER membrane protein complex subunit 4